MDKIEEILEFWNEGGNKSRFSRDVQDFQRSKNFASGNGFSDVSSKVWSEHRARVYADFLSPIVSGIVSMMELAPPEITGHEMDRKIVSDALREILNDGKSFLLAYNEGGTLKVKRLSNLQTYINEDLTKALHLSKISKEQSEKRGVKFGGADKVLIEAFSKTLEIGSKETYLLTYYEKTEDGVEISSFIGKEQAGKTVTLALRNLPVVPFFGDPCFIDNKPNYRGLYYKAKDLLNSISFYMSYIQERVAVAPNVQFLVAEETLGDNPQQWSEMNGEPRAMLTYKSRDPVDGGTNSSAFPPPQQVDGLPLPIAIAVLDKFLEMLRGIMGGDMAGEARSHETAESVLLRREKKDASGNAYIRSMLSGLDRLAEVLTDYYAILGSPRTCEVVDRYFVKAKQERDLQTLMSLMQIAATSPAFASAMADKTDLDDETKQKAILAANVQGMLGNMQTLQQQNQEQANLIQNLQAQLEGANKQNMQLANSIDSQVWAAQVKAETELQKTLIQNETEILKIQIDKDNKDIDFKLRFEEMNRRQAEAIAKITQPQAFKNVHLTKEI